MCVVTLSCARSASYFPNGVAFVNTIDVVHRPLGNLVGGDEHPIIISAVFSVLSGRGRQVGMNEDRLKQLRGGRGEEGGHSTESSMWPRVLA